MNLVVRPLLDTNVVLDVPLEREPFAEASTRAVDAHVQNQVQGLLGATTVTTLFYLVSTVKGAQPARERVEALLSLFEIAAVNRRGLDRASASGLDDFEDAVLHEAARGAGAGGRDAERIRRWGSESVDLHAGKTPGRPRSERGGVVSRCSSRAWVVWSVLLREALGKMSRLFHD